MELCLIGLFFLVEDAKGDAACVPQAIIMIVAMVLTALYQLLLNMSFAPLFRHLPVTVEDEAVLRDEAFERAQAQRLSLENPEEVAAPVSSGPDIEMTTIDKEISKSNKLAKLNPANLVKKSGPWHSRSNNQGHSSGNTTDDAATADLMRKRRHRDLEAQQKIANALYGGYSDEIEDLTPEERDLLVRHAFQHYALRAGRPTLWIPRDDIGVSDDEIKRTRDFAGNNIWITNVGAALDGKFRVVYGRNPPDFSSTDLINL
jgi:hypothetical protein